MTCSVRVISRSKVVSGNGILGKLTKFWGVQKRSSCFYEDVIFPLMLSRLSRCTSGHVMHLRSGFENSTEDVGMVGFAFLSCLFAFDGWSVFIRCIFKRMYSGLSWCGLFAMITSSHAWSKCCCSRGAVEFQSFLRIGLKQEPTQLLHRGVEETHQVRHAMPLAWSVESLIPMPLIF